MKCKLGLSVIAFLTLSLNAQNLSDCFGDTVCNDNFHIDGDSIVLDKHTYTTNGSVKLTNASLNLLNGTTLVVNNADGIHASSKDYIISGGNLVTTVLEVTKGDANIIGTNVAIANSGGAFTTIRGNLYFANGSLKFDTGASYARLGLWKVDVAGFGHSRIIFDNTKIFSELDAGGAIRVDIGDVVFKNTNISNITFDRENENTVNSSVAFKNSKLKKVGIGTKNTTMFLKNVIFDNIVLDNSELNTLNPSTPNINVANLTIKNIDGVNSYINAKIEVKESTNIKDITLKGENAGNLTIQNSVIDKRANITANKYTLIDSDFTGDIKSGTKLSMINSKLKGDISLSAGAVSFDNSTLIGSIVADKLSSKNSTIKGQLITNTLNATNTTFYIYGGGVNTSFYDSYSGAIIVKDKAIGSGNIIHLANTDLSKLTGNLVPIALVDTKDVAITSTQTVNASKATGGGYKQKLL